MFVMFTIIGTNYCRTGDGRNWHSREEEAAYLQDARGFTGSGHRQTRRAAGRGAGRVRARRDLPLVGGRAPERTRKFLDVKAGQAKVALVVDDLVSTDPWTPRGLRVYGTAD